MFTYLLCLGIKVHELCEQGGGSGLSFPIPFFPPSLISHTGFVGVKSHGRRRCLILPLRLVELSVGHSSLQFDKETDRQRQKDRDRKTETEAQRGKEADKEQNKRT